MTEVIESLLSRVRTFTINQWRYQNSQLLNPYFLASLGYQVRAFCILQCHICHHKVSISEEQKNLSQIELELNTHQTNCYYLNVNKVNITQKMLYSYMDYLLQILDCIEPKYISQFPLINSKSLQFFVQKDKDLFTRVLSLYEINSQRYKISFILRILGWHFKKDQNDNQYLYCHFCGRKINVQQYQTTNNDIQNIELQLGASAQKLFDPVQEHRYFCMWVNKKGGWLIFLQYLYDKFHQLSYFKFKTAHLETKRTKIQIQMYVDSFKSKLQSTVSKLKHVTRQVGNLCEKMGKDRNLSICPEQSQFDVKKLRKRQLQLDFLKQDISRYYLQYSLSNNKSY